MGNFSSIGIDLVAMCVNDLIVSGARPLAFLDYYGVSKLDRLKGQEIISGILEGCRLSECDLVGGETAEMPNYYAPNCFDLVGFAMGINEKMKIVDGKQIEPGDKIIGIPSSQISLQWLFFNSQCFSGHSTFTGINVGIVNPNKNICQREFWIYCPNTILKGWHILLVVVSMKT